MFEKRSLIPFSSKILIICFLLFLFLIPFWLSPYFLHFLIMMFFWAYLGQCWNILGGLCGQLSLGHAAFFAIGAYTSSIFFVSFNLSPWIGLLLGGILGTIVALFIGYLSFRYGLKGPYFALVTIAFAELLRIITLSVNFTNGPVGILIPLKKESLINFQFSGKIPFYYIILLVVILITWIFRRIQGSKLGYYLLSIRENEDAANALGVNILNYKLIAIAISAFFTSLGGTFYAQYIAYIDPSETFGWHVSIEMILRTLVGGIGIIWGPLLGSLILSTISEISRVFWGDIIAGFHMLIYATILILVVLFSPRGIYVLIRNRINHISKLKLS